MALHPAGTPLSLSGGFFPAPQASLYLHIPFCAGACDYCDFYSLPAIPGDPRFPVFIKLLLRDTEDMLRRFEVRRIPSLYIGGGTPSLLGASGIERLLEGLRSLLPEWPQELSLEANPESADASFLAACREGGITRISLGVQTFHEGSRRLVRRVGEGALLPERLDLVREFFPAAFSADLITGLPGQDNGILLRDIEKLLLREPAHVSLYALSVEAGTPLEKAVHDVPPVRLPERDEADSLWLLGRDTLEAAGYTQYEVSNFALPGKRSIHNTRYWRMENWLAAGPAASATIIDDRTGTGFRYTVRPNLGAYLNRSGSVPPLTDTENLDPLTLIRETCLMGFRCIEGPDHELFTRRFGRDPEDYLPRTCSRWRRRGLMHPGKTALNREGLLFLNPFLEDVFEELGNSLPVRSSAQGPLDG